MKQSMFSKQGQKGFTLLELLIVVTIIAILSVGAILAYDGLTDKAQSATAANNTITADQSIRNFRAVTGNYPNQWDHLVSETGGDDFEFVADETYRVLAKVDASGISAQIAEAFEEVGIDELQVRSASATVATDDAEPNLQFNEGATAGASFEIELDDTFPSDLVVIPTATSQVFCDVDGNDTALIRDVDDVLRTAGDTDAATAQNYMIKVNDKIGEGACRLVVAFGFGHDAAHSTQDSNVAIAAAPAYVSNKINPAQTYARFIALFEVGEDDDGDNNIEADEIYNKAKLVGVIDPEGNIIDENVAAATDEGQEEDND